MARTLGQVFTEVARLTGTLVNAGTATAGTTTTLTDAVNEQTAVANSGIVTGTFLVVTGGTSAGTAKEINAYGTLGVMGWTGAVAAPDATSTWVRVQFRPQLYLDAISTVTRDYRRRQALQYRSTALVTNSLLDWYGDFEEWNAAGTVPTGWLAGAGATGLQVTTTTDAANPPRHGTYALEVTSSAGGGYFEYLVPPQRLSALLSQSLTLHGYMRVEAGVTARVTITATDAAGVTTTQNYDTASTTWVRLEDTTATKFVCPATLSNLSIRVTAVTAGGVCHFDDLALWGPYLGVQRLPALMAGLKPELLTEDGYPSDNPTQAEVFWHPLTFGRHWAVFRDATDGYYYIRWNVRQESGRHILIEGYKYPVDQASFTGNVDPDPDWLSKATAMSMLATQTEPASQVRLKTLEAQLTEKAAGNGADDGRSREHGLVWVEDW